MAQDLKLKPLADRVVIKVIEETAKYLGIGITNKDLEKIPVGIHFNELGVC